MEKCAPFFHNQSFNVPSEIDRLAHKFAQNGSVIVAIEQDTVIGFSAFYSNDHIEQTAFLSMIIVVGNVQGLGVGKALLDETVRVCLSKGMKRLKLEVANDNVNALKFYERNGFTFESSKSDNTTIMVKGLL